MKVANGGLLLASINCSKKYSKELIAKQLLRPQLSALLVVQQ
ncbi:hypothetical protein P20652_1314 [Pseudoalteromonas sp. BSi20652]|nr:hypothetical protein P20652_1314 [Pseudoalteromonas sp. BSi20652]